MGNNLGENKGGIAMRIERVLGISEDKRVIYALLREEDTGMLWKAHIHIIKGLIHTERW